MLNDILTYIKQESAISDWILTEDHSVSQELFFVRDKLDMNRGTDILEYQLHIYLDFEKDGKACKGDAQVMISPADSPEEIKSKIRNAVFGAGFIQNPSYELPVFKAPENVPSLKAYDNAKDLREKYDEVHEIFFKDYPYRSRVNSCEIFAISGTRRVISSRGCDLSYPTGKFVFELVTDDNSGSEPVEIFRDYEMKHIDLKAIEAIVTRQLSETEGRSRAVKAKTMKNVRMILSGDDVESFLHFYLVQARDASIYQGYSRAKLHEAFLPSDAAQKVNIRMNPFLDFSVAAAPVDDEGCALSPYVLMKDGVVENLRTEARFSSYMGIPNTGKVSCFEVEGGEKSLEEYRKGDYVELMAFSSFVMDPAAGDFGGEFRLAKWKHDGVEEWITGGSLSENIFEVQGRMLFSSECVKRKNSIAPEAIIIDGVTISGE